MDVNAPIALAGASYRTLDDAVRDFTTVWGARNDGDFHHTSVAVLTKGRYSNLQVERSNSTAKHLEWGGALLGAALLVLAPSAGIEVLSGVGVSGAGAMVSHFHQHARPEDLAGIGGLLQVGAAGLVVVALNRRGRAVTQLLTNAEARSSVDMPWGDLEEELTRGFARSSSWALVAT